MISRRLPNIGVDPWWSFWRIFVIFSQISFILNVPDPEVEIRVCIIGLYKSYLTFPRPSTS